MKSKLKRNCCSEFASKFSGWKLRLRDMTESLQMKIQMKMENKEKKKRLQKKKCSTYSKLIISIKNLLLNEKCPESQKINHFLNMFDKFHDFRILIKT